MENKKPEYKEISTKMIEEIFNDLFYQGRKEPTQSLDEKIVSGYLYTIYSGDMNNPQKGKNEGGHRRIMMQAGKGGVDTYIKTCREQGIPDLWIGDTIWLEMEFEDESRKWLRISDINVTEKNTVEQENKSAKEKSSEEEAQKS